jgi:hypothetical protein
MVQAGVGPYQTAPGFPPGGPQTVGDGLSVAVAVKNAMNDPLSALKNDVTSQQPPTSGPPPHVSNSSYPKNVNILYFNKRSVTGYYEFYEFRTSNHTALACMFKIFTKN